jgi:hypothetical protein
MNFSTLKYLLLLLMAAVLTACGGGGGSDGGGFTPPQIAVTATAASPTIGINSSTDVTVRVLQANGSPVANGTQVTGSVTPGGIGNLAALTGGLVATTSGGNATFRFQSGGQPGTANLSFSVANPGAPGNTASGNTSITIGSTPTGDSRLTVEPVRTSLPVNGFNVDPFIGSPYMTEVVITARTASGQPINLPNGVQVSVNPVGATGGFTTLDDPATANVNEFFVRLGQGPVDVVAGRATIFVHSLNFSGPTTLTVTMVDPETGQTVITTRTFNITTITPPLPSEIVISPQIGRPVYVQGAGGNTSTQLEIRVNDAIGQPVPDPVSGNNAFNNVRLELLGENSGERLSGLNAAGANASGTTINIRTSGGIAGAIFTAGTRSGTVVVRATSDRADNNVDNGIQDPVVTERSVVVSDGRLFNIEITQPVTNALTINPVDPGVTPTPGTTPGSPDGTYSLTVAVIATDRLGNPVLPGTLIKFGLIDHPQFSGFFDISGNDGNPQEGGTLFTAPSGHFRTAGGGAGPGDALVIFGKEVPGNRDLEGARVVATVNSETSLTVQRRFNRNDDTGVTVDYGNVLPYVIGRAVSGNIVAEAVTNELGVARTTMTYPVSRLGRPVVVWAQGDADIIAGTPETASDVDILTFAGIAPLSITATPSAIPANTSSPVSVCVQDALGSPLQGVTIGFSFTGLVGTGSVDGRPNAGTLATVTGVNGCTIANVTTGGVSSDGATVDFTAGGDVASVSIVRGPLVLQARPSVITSSSTLLTLTLLNANGLPQAGYQIVGTCTGTNGTIIALSEGPGVTNAAGETTVMVTATNLNQVNQAGGGSCTFRTVDNSASTVVPLIGEDLCLTPISPQPEGCTPPPQTVVTLTLTDPNAATLPAGFSVASAPGGLACSVGSGGTASCTASFDRDDTTLGLSTLPAGTGPAVNWTGACVPVGGVNPSNAATLPLSNATAACTATSPP